MPLDDDDDLELRSLFAEQPRPPERGDGVFLVDPNENLTIDDVIENCMFSRVYFAEVVLGVVLEDWQYEVLHALDNGATRISIRSGNGAGKTCLLAIIILHYILFRNDVKIPVTAPSSGQLKDGLIPETRKWMNRLPSFLYDLLDTTQDRIVRKDNPEQNFVSFRTARRETPEALQGIHAAFVMCVVDEASAVPDEVYEAAQGTMSTPGSIFIMISNPTRLQGYFHKSQTINKAFWTTFHVTSFDTSRVDQSFVDQIERDYGKLSDQYRVKVLGEFPSRDEQALIGLDVVRAAFSRQLVLTDDMRRIWGVDVGRGGDLSTLVERAERMVTMAKGQNYSDTMQTVAWVHAAYNNALIKPEAIYVDVIGIGAGVVDRLRELKLPVIGVNVGELPSMKSRFPRMRDELWWAAKEFLESMDCAFEIRDSGHYSSKQIQQVLESELCAPLQLFTGSGKDAVESKPQMKSRGVKSPNFADAFCLTFAYEGGAMAGATTATSSWNQPLDYEPVGVW